MNNSLIIKNININKIIKISIRTNNNVTVRNNLVKMNKNNKKLIFKIIIRNNYT